MRLKEFIEKFSINSFEKNMKLLKTKLDNKERILHAVWGSAPGIKNLPCVLVLTDKRIIRFGKRIISDEIITLPIKSLTFVDEVSEWRNKTTYFYFINGSVSFSPVYNKENLDKMEKLMAVLKVAMNVDEKKTKNEDDIPTLIRKLAKLYKDGIINKREFEDKKKELLKRV